jgi:dienelactone hydrolase
MDAPVAPPTRSRRLRRVAIVVLVALVAIVVGAWYIYLRPQPLLPEASAALASTAEVTVTNDGGYLTFTPAGETPSTGLIVYPGGRVPPAAYARAAREIAANGVLVVIVPMPLDLAILGANRADRVREAHREIERWVIAGHSLGGAMACRYAAEHPGAVAGLVLWAAYCVDDVSDQDLVVRTIYGKLDAGAGRMGSAKSLDLLPPDAEVVRIPGGNHGQMGDYTGQPNDPPAKISRDDQRDTVVGSTLYVVMRVDQGS